ncbi:MAG: uL13 family ribosomal protein [Patescibacteria group bacterium]|nr:uL13 family ribosomal protein [Patescibacteria group bacterium]MDE1943870.1 uL13 family ribosomal protein [Patescibacteria group bacterium]MDE1944948.1 uL13 family ribosomal protein [Patescibacteria group bacterium]MDE2057548.1 uL13 family ribosomal protein [Patescibacteria group bacterium]
MTSVKAPAPMSYTIDATDRTLGRVASEAAHALLGKRSPQVSGHRAHPITVTIENASRLHLPARRVAGKVYTHYTGYPGGLRSTGMAELIAKKGIEEVLRRTVDGMIPRNRLRAPRMKNLVVKA